MEFTKKEKEYIEKEISRRNEAEILFRSFIKKYKRRKKLKQAHLTKNIKNRFLGETIFVDMIISTQFSETEKEFLFVCLISMPADVLREFEWLYFKSSKSKFENHMKILGDHLKRSKELHNTYGVALQLHNEKTLTDDKLNYVAEKLRDNKRKYGKYTKLHEEIDSKLMYLRKTKIGLIQKSIIISVLENHIENGDNPYLLEAYEECGKSISKLYERFRTGYSKYKKRLH